MSLLELPRISLGHWPTPLDDLPNLSTALGGPRILVKREDLTGVAMGGSKARKLEFVFARVQREGYNAVITTSGSQSNWCCQVAAVARRLKMEVGVVLFSGVHPETQGNLLLQNLMDTKVKILEGQLRIVDGRSVRTGSYGDSVVSEMNRMADDFRKRGHNPVIVNAMDVSEPYVKLVVCGWVEGLAEIWQQLQDKKINAQYLIYAQGGGGTAAGLTLGIKLLKLPLKVIGIAVSRSAGEGRYNVATAVNMTAEFLGKDVSIAPDEVTVYDDYIGEGYGVMTEGCREAIRLVARTEGIFLDPVYTGKAMAGLIDLIRKGRFTSKDTIVFVHTGGLPALFAYDKELTL